MEREPGIPSWVRDALASAPRPAAAELRRYDYMKQDFFAALDAAATVQTEAGSALKRTIDAVFSLGGKLLKCAADAVDTVMPPLQAPGYALATTRSAGGIAQPQPPGPTAWIGRATKSGDGVRIEATTYLAGQKTSIELNLLTEPSGVEIRPFTLKVCDDEGKELAAPTEVGVAESAPRLPGPTAGVYVFHLSWLGGERSMRVEFAES